ncbi:MAG TPA: methanogen output domain 1-containing protein, partial [Methylobacter sp.]
MTTNSSLSDLSPVFFLQTFILELMHASEQQGQKHCEQLIEHIAKTAGCFFEETYREEAHNSGLLDKERYTELILGLKNNIGGKFSLVSSNQDCITVVNTSCPFGDRVTNFPELCRMTSSVFGGIAARNFGYAKVEIKQSIARHDGKCEVCVYTNPNAAKDRPGMEYT